MRCRNREVGPAAWVQIQTLLQRSQHTGPAFPCLPSSSRELELHQNSGGQREAPHLPLAHRNGLINEITSCITATEVEANPELRELGSMLSNGPALCGPESWIGGLYLGNTGTVSLPEELPVLQPQERNFLPQVLSCFLSLQEAAPLQSLVLREPP